MYILLPMIFPWITCFFCRKFESHCIIRFNSSCYISVILNMHRNYCFSCFIVPMEIIVFHWNPFYLLESSSKVNVLLVWEIFPLRSKANKSLVHLNAGTLLNNSYMEFTYISSIKWQMKISPTVRCETTYESPYW